MTAAARVVGPVTLSAGYHDLLMNLLQLPTAGPLETGPDGPPPRLAEAQAAYAQMAARVGFDVVHHGGVSPAELARFDVPAIVRRQAQEQPGFLACQPSLVVRLGPELPRAATVMFNVHLDTVAGWETPRRDERRVWGRGAVDAKGPAVALLAGIEAARAAEPALGRTVAVLIQAVAGEEGGAMGVFGTRPLVERGFVGRLNVFCEPTSRRYLPRATGASTACIRVAGRDAIDDQPGAGHNASVLLGFLASYLAEVLPGGAEDARVCIAGLHTGTLHNRVYGRGQLLLNLAYGSTSTGRLLEAVTETAVAEGVARFRGRFRGHRDLALTAAEADSVTTVEWLKRGLPALSGTDPWVDLIAAEAGLARWPDGDLAFTCDAIWMHGLKDAATIVLGPGDLVEGNAHAAGEHIDIGEMDGFASDIARLLVAFARAGGFDGSGS